MVNRRTFIKGTAAVPVMGAALGTSRINLVSAQDEPVQIGSKNFTEQFILGQMYGMLLEEAGIPIELSLNLGGTGIAHAALTSGEIDMYPEYPGTALVEVLDRQFSELTDTATPAAATPATAGTPGAGQAVDELVYNTVKDFYEQEFNVTLLEETPFNNTQAVAVERSFAEENDLTTISDLAAIAGDLTISAPADFVEREDGYQGLLRTYGGEMEEMEILSVDPSLKYRAIESGDADVVLAFGTDAQISALDLVVLEDDLGLFPPYHVAPFVRQETIDAYPAIPESLNALAPLLTGEVVQGLNA
ncbi:MAG: glycine betaine ABC transporter substrate-binding protein, partial [Thermomicrobiales bacterium]